MTSLLLISSLVLIFSVLIVETWVFYLLKRRAWIKQSLTIEVMNQRLSNTKVNFKKVDEGIDISNEFVFLKPLDYRNDSLSRWSNETVYDSFQISKADISKDFTHHAGKTARIKAFGFYERRSRTARDLFPIKKAFEIVLSSKAFTIKSPTDPVRINLQDINGVDIWSNLKTIRMTSNVKSKIDVFTIKFVTKNDAFRFARNLKILKHHPHLFDGGYKLSLSNYNQVKNKKITNDFLSLTELSWMNKQITTIDLNYVTKKQGNNLYREFKLMNRSIHKGLFSIHSINHNSIPLRDKYDKRIIEKKSKILFWVSLGLTVIYLIIPTMLITLDMRKISRGSDIPKITLENFNTAREKHGSSQSIANWWISDNVDGISYLNGQYLSVDTIILENTYKENFIELKAINDIFTLDSFGNANLLSVNPSGSKEIVIQNKLIYGLGNQLLNIDDLINIEITNSIIIFQDSFNEVVTFNGINDLSIIDSVVIAPLAPSIINDGSIGSKYWNMKNSIIMLKEQLNPLSPNDSYLYNGVEYIFDNLFSFQTSINYFVDQFAHGENVTDIYFVANPSNIIDFNQILFGSSIINSNNSDGSIRIENSNFY